MIIYPVFLGHSAFTSAVVAVINNATLYSQKVPSLDDK